MEGQVKCSICNQRFRDPKVLPCFHCFCRDCIEMLRIRGRDAFHCPECRKDVSIPDNDPESLPDAFPVYHRLELARYKEKLESTEVTMSCDACFYQRSLATNAEAFCTNCGEHICAECRKKHETEFEFSDHRVISFEELVQSRDHSQHHEVLKRSRSVSFQRHFMHCNYHRGEMLSRYCQDCTKFICKICADTNHKSHKHESIDRAAEKCQKTLKDQLPNVRVLHKRISGAVDEVQKVRVNVDNQGKTLASFVDDEFDRLTILLNRYRELLKTKVNQVTKGKLDKLAKQALELEHSAAELHRVETFAEDTLDTATEREMLLLHGFVHEQVSETVQRCSNVSIEPIETSNLAVTIACRPHLTEVCQKHAAVYCAQADLSRCTAEGPGLRYAETFRTTQFTVRVYDKSGKLCESSQDVRVIVKCLANSVSFNAEVSSVKSDGNYTVSYSPNFRGLHEVHVKVNDNPVRGSPYVIRAYYPPNQLGKSYGIIDGVKGPRGIAVSKDGNLLVTEWNGGRVVELDRNGRYLRCFGSGQDGKKQLYNPAGITTDTIGNIYVIDAVGKQCCVAKYSADGEFLKAVGKEGTGPGEFKNPRGLTVSKQNELFICDRDNNRVQVFDTNLKFVRSIDVGSVDRFLSLPSKPNDIAFDQAGNMYITDYSNNCILCFSMTEQYLFAFSKEGNSPGCLAGPEGIHVDEFGFVYVTECRNHRVSVFRINGDFVIKFGSLGNGDNVKFPMGIVTDENNFVYVCELFSNRIQLF